jgi:CheY-like chemotaxis protein
MKPVDIYEVLGAVREFLVHALDRRITLKSSLSPGPFLVDADSTQLQNVLLNICLNSRDAMPDGGALELSTKLIELDAATVSARVPEGRPGHYVCIEVRDTGTGMDAETLKHAFDPFFTTKEPGRGTGLGLSVVFGSIREHGGSVTLSSSPGKGSCCTLWLPQSTSAPGVATLPPATGRSRRGLRVMLVDDEPGVCRTTAQLMRQLGHNVQALRSGSKALAHLKNHWGGYDLLVLDVMMPHPTGVEVHETLVEQGIVLPTVFVSGYSEQHMLEGITDGEGVVFLQKPFRQQELEAAIARCTQSGRGAGRKGPDGPAYSASQAPAPSQSSASESAPGLSSDSSRPAH